jgi:hypothetical protein
LTRCTDKNYLPDKRSNNPDESIKTPQQQLEDYRREVQKIDKLMGNVNTTRSENSSNRHIDDCGNDNTLSLRNARIGKDLIKCHTQKDVRSIFGKSK